MDGGKALEAAVFFLFLDLLFLFVFPAKKITLSKRDCSESDPRGMMMRDAGCFYISLLSDRNKERKIFKQARPPDGVSGEKREETKKKEQAAG